MFSLELHDRIGAVLEMDVMAKWSGQLAGMARIQEAHGVVVTLETNR
ncbi:MAG: hypothetical protein JOY79_05090 [Acidobacteriaceae bacterium]|nr:hypothetical protein [Acidobacteriaceae bacterium]